ncbi:uncharacterized protein V2V93DRAFT_181207 [Kockiozyma suomiensis]|uniref:uncharacterized protein n=1 Tax=Kockiozyma suomiensis TaxID=1337062 RepID=UPI003342F1D4
MLILICILVLICILPALLLLPSLYEGLCTRPTLICLYASYISKHLAFSTLFSTLFFTLFSISSYFVSFQLFLFYFFLSFYSILSLRKNQRTRSAPEPRTIGLGELAPVHYYCDATQDAAVPPLMKAY